MLLGFKKQFAPKILDGSKKFTIRNPRKREPKIGEQLHMYTGLRTKFTEKITSEHTLKGIQLVNITGTVSDNQFALYLQVDGRFLNKEQCEEFAKADGFINTFYFVDYWAKEIGTKKKHFEQGNPKPIAVTRSFSVNDLIMYHWTDLRF